jgi:hypothetical protein
LPQNPEDFIKVESLQAKVFRGFSVIVRTLGGIPD